MVLQDSFEGYIHKHLYLNCGKKINDDENYASRDHNAPAHHALETDAIKAIVNLARPRRTGMRLESIISFNFDDLIEQALSLHGIDYCSIWKEGQDPKVALPIYHVHGFLPSKGKVDSPNLVFSEETYHSQFIDPYSWANLIQLNVLSANICLFVGLSLSDPNLRRLLDISWRRSQRCRHYIISRKPKSDEKIGRITTALFEQDANSLGLNVIWCSEYSDIPEILTQIAP